jgi:hypothetical protein
MLKRELPKLAQPKRGMLALGRPECAMLKHTGLVHEMLKDFTPTLERRMLEQLEHMMQRRG